MSSSTQVRIFLTCPDCEQESLFPAATLVAGGRVACPHCGTELLVSHDRDTPDGPPVWRLEMPDLAEERAPGV